MKPVGTGLNAGVDDCARRVSELGRVVAGLHFEFRQSIRRRLGHKAGAIVKIDDIGVIVDAIQDEIILLGPLAVCVEVALAGTARALRRDDSGRQLGNKHPVASIQWHAIDGARVHCLAY